MFDFGGVITSSPFEAFARYEREHGLPAGFIRRVNSTNPDTNAWAEAGARRLDVDDFADAFDAEARASATGSTAAPSWPFWVVTSGRPWSRRSAAAPNFNTACVTNNFGAVDMATPPEVAGSSPCSTWYWSRGRWGAQARAALLRVACGAVGVRPEEVVFLDDLGINLKPARAMGMHTIKVADPVEALAELSAVTGLALAV